RRKRNPGTCGPAFRFAPCGLPRLRGSRHDPPLHRRESPVSGLLATLAIIRRLAAPYFRSEEKWVARGLLAAVISLMLCDVAIDVLVNQWRARFYNALQDYNWGAFTRELIVFSLLGSASVVVVVYQLYLMQWLEIRWRRWMTERYAGAWL